jgi:hypothetical protein
MIGRGRKQHTTASSRELEARADRVADELARRLVGEPQTPSSDGSLPARIAASARAALGHDFSTVRIHADDEAARSAGQHQALAYTRGNEVVFGTGRFETGSAAGRHLLAHELAHVAQQATGPAPAVQRQSVPSAGGPAPLTGQLRLTFDLSGRIEVTVSGPQNTPIVSSPTIGIRRDADGHYHLLVGGKDKLVTAEEIPAMLRSIGGGTATGSRPTGQRIQLRVPGCQQLAHLNYRFENYDLNRRLFHAPGRSIGGVEWLPLTRELFDALCSLCRPAGPRRDTPPQPEGPPVTPPQPAVPPVTPPGTGAA